MIRKLLILFFLVPIIACSPQENRKVSVNRNFNIPIVVQGLSKDTFEFAKSDFLSEARFLFYGKYKFTDTLKLLENFKQDTTYWKDFIWDPRPIRLDDSLMTDGFQIFADYKTTIHHKDRYLPKGLFYFPVYVVNETSRTKLFFGKDSHILGLQEAVDTTDYEYWHPIDYKGFDFCGNGEYALKIHPGEFVMFLVPKYSGNEQGKMRVRLEIGESVYLSKSFIGTFNREQFILKKETWIYDRLKDEKGATIQYILFGAIPKGYSYYK